MYAPEKNVTRGDFVKLLVEILDLDSDKETIMFKDVKESDYYYEAIKNLLYMLQLVFYILYPDIYLDCKHLKCNFII